MRTITIVLICIALLSACTGTKTDTDKPSWIENPGNGAVGSSTTHVKGRHYQEELAIARARERLAAQYGVEISSIQTIHERIVNDKAYVTSDKEVLQRIDGAIVKTHVRATWYDQAHDEIWVWVYPVSD